MRLPWHRRDHRELTRATECLNCGTTLNGLNFCPTCGQENFDHRTSLGRLVMFWWDRNVSIDGKLMRTLGVMLTRPGALTVAYLAGQRARYTPPLQLYFLTGLLYFFLLGWVLEKELEVADDRTIAADTLRRTSPLPITAMDSARRAAVVKDTLVKEREIGLRFGPTPRGQPAVYADLSDAPVSDSLRGLKQDSIGRRIARLGGWYKATDDLREAFISQSAKVAIERVFKRQLEALTLLSLPLFALALYLFYRRSHPYFIDHLVAGTHYSTPLVSSWPCRSLPWARANSALGQVSHWWASCWATSCSACAPSTGPLGAG